jgi:hypothetical protein
MSDRVWVAAGLAVGFAVGLASGCGREPVASCDDALDGVWVAVARDGSADGTPAPTAASGEPLRFHIVERSNVEGARLDSARDAPERAARRRAIEIFPMYDATVPPTDPGDRRAPAARKRDAEVIYAPPVFVIERRGSALIGRRYQRVTRGARACVLRGQAAIRRCGGDRLTLAWVPPGPIDWSRCAAPGPAWTQLALRRVR